MRSIHFRAYGHENVISQHKTTVELTTESTLSIRGNCIVGVRSTLALRDLDVDIKSMAQSSQTEIHLKMTTEGITEEIIGQGSTNLSYSDATSMVARKSSFECGRTVMINADKTASDLNRVFVEKIKNPETVIECELVYFNQ